MTEFARWLGAASLSRTVKPDNRDREGIAIVDPEGNLIYASSTFAQLHEYPQEELIGRNIRGFALSGDEKEISRLLQRAEEEKFCSWETSHLRRDGSLFRVSVNIMAIPAGADLPVYFIFIVRDLSPQGSRQMAEERHLLYARALDEAHDAILITTPEGGILYANGSAQRLYGYPQAELSGKNLRDLVPVHERSRVKRFRSRLLKEGRWAGEMTHLRKGGHPDKVAVKLSMSVVHGDRGQPQFLIASSQDVSELRLLEANLRQAQKMEAVGLLASGLAHNINSPLAAITVTAEMAQAKHPEIKEFGDIMQAAARIQEIVTNLMTKSRQDQSIEEIELDLNQLVKTEIKFLEANLFFKHNVELNVSLDPRLPKIRGLYSDFSQCFHNIVQNALDAMETASARKLSVETRHDHHRNQVCLYVRDTGGGIPEEYLDRIFEPFFTTKSNDLGEGDAELPRPSGTGLGLSTTYQLLKKYRAGISVSSQISAGSEFRVTIPVSQAPQT